MSMLNLKSYGKLIQLEATSPMTGGILYFLGAYFIRFIRTLLLLSIWKVVFPHMADTTLNQLDEVLKYTLLAAVFWQQIDVQTTASTTFWEGTLSSRFLRPLSVFGQYISETIGKWIPGLLFFSLPVLLLSPVLGIDMRPPDPGTFFVFILSLITGAASGFALDFILTGVAVSLSNEQYPIFQIKAAVILFLSGALIPLSILPFGIGRLLEWLPFAAMASAPLTIYTSADAEVTRILILQLAWCVILWLVAIYIWNKNRQRLVVFGG